MRESRNGTLGLAGNAIVVAEMAMVAKSGALGSDRLARWQQSGIA